MVIKEVLNNANCIVNHYLSDQLQTALAEVEMIRDKQACDCRNCITGAVEKYNSLLWQFVYGDEELFYKYDAEIYDVNGTMMISLGDDDEGTTGNSFELP